MTGNSGFGKRLSTWRAPNQRHPHRRNSPIFAGALSRQYFALSTDSMKKGLWGAIKLNSGAQLGHTQLRISKDSGRYVMPKTFHSGHESLLGLSSQWARSDSLARFLGDGL